MSCARDGYTLSVDTLLIAKTVVPFCSVRFRLLYTWSTTKFIKSEDREVGQG